jgi:hypothetical protein
MHVVEGRSAAMSRTLSTHSIVGQWVFLDWVPAQTSGQATTQPRTQMVTQPSTQMPMTTQMSAPVVPTRMDSVHSRGTGLTIYGTYSTENPTPNELLDPGIAPDVPLAELY